MKGTTRGIVSLYIYVAVYLISWYSRVSQNKYTWWERSPVGSVVYDVLSGYMDVDCYFIFLLDLLQKHFCFLFCIY